MVSAVDKPSQVPLVVLSGGGVALARRRTLEMHRATTRDCGDQHR